MEHRLQRFDMTAEAAHPIQILLIEDSEEDALLVQQLLGLTRRFFYNMIRCASLSQALETLPRAHPQVILTDLNLPDSRGYDTFCQVFEHAADIPMVLLTNLDDEALALQAIRNGAQDYLLKTELSGQLLARAIRYAIQRKHSEDALRESHERYMLAVEGATDGLWDWNLKTNRIYFSPRWKAMLGYEDSEIRANPDEWLQRIHNEDLAQVRVALAAHVQGYSQHFECEYRIRHKDGAYRWALARGLAVRDVAGKAYRMAGSQTDITARKRTEEQLQFDAFHDTLTGLTNRALFLDRLGRAIEHTHRHPEVLFAVLFLDLDRFKVINDSLGHSLGDQLLSACARKLEGCVRVVDTVSRFGGDEFVILLEDVKSEQEALDVASRIQHDLQDPIDLDGHQVVISASIGIVLSSLGYEDSDNLLRDADIAMYQAKMLGKACHVLFEAGMRQRMIHRLELENDLRKALENQTGQCPDDQELQVHYQPIVSLCNWKITGFEALIRWKHPRRGQIPPKEFIPVAEETGLIHSLGMWVLRRACQQMRLWQNQYPLDPPLSIHVNVSGKQFGQPDFVDNVQRVLGETGLEARSLSLEITESLFVENDERFNDMLRRLCSLGIQLQIDDFGTGYSSFSYLQRLPVSSIKIDSTFIANMKTGNNHAEIVRSIVTLARSLGMKAIAEGVESEDQMAQLQALECAYGQGFYISRPAPGAVGQEILRLSQGTGKLGFRF
jgi:diguanylate cyclase (GGDEF)-like protein/PAS domain S-box-containing protein